MSHIYFPPVEDAQEPESNQNQKPGWKRLAYVLYSVSAAIEDAGTHERERIERPPQPFVCLGGDWRGIGRSNDVEQILQVSFMSLMSASPVLSVAAGPGRERPSAERR